MPTSNDTTSAIVGATTTGRHLLHIEGYSHTKALLNGEHIKSQSFTVGGRAWRIWYYPNGACDDQGAMHGAYISVFVVLDDGIPEPAYAEAAFHFLDQAEKPVPAYTQTTSLKEYPAAGAKRGIAAFIKRELLEASAYLVDDCFKIRCDVSVSKQFYTENRGDAPPSPDLHRHLGDLLMAKAGADVTFQVAGVTFSAHRRILAARSQGFKAKLFVVAMAESTAAAGVCIRIDDMVPQVFEALLHFVYTDSLPDVTGQDDVLMAQHQSEAADRYDMQRLKLICEENLCRCLEISTAATMLLFAQQHRCHRLREACVVS